MNFTTAGNPITTAAVYEPENFFAGDFPIKTDYGKIKKDAVIRAHAPVVKTANGIEEATASNLGNLIGIAASEPNGDEVVYYLTGEFFTGAIVLPSGVTAEALKDALRKLSIFLKEVRTNA
ncbi:MAG: hypothetical protein FWH20_00480 [Oscillospiraceae bacterium]|nr:hypothetical protein [Oscillospiraceae bacterium]